MTSPQAAAEPGDSAPRQEGDLRIGPVLPLLAVLRSLGAEPAPLLERAGVPAALFNDAENTIAFADLSRLLDICADATGCAHLGLLVGARFDRHTLGPLGELMQHCDTVAQALRSLVLYLQLNDRGAVPMLLHLSASRVAFGYSIYQPDIGAAAQIHDGAIAISLGLMRKLCGAAFRPMEVSFAHRAPADPKPYRRFFAAPLRFDAELSALSFAPRWLSHAIVGADAARHARLDAAMRAAVATATQASGLSPLVRRALHAMVFEGSDSAPAVARWFGLHERALRRQLRAEGTNIRALSSKVRFDLATQLLRDTRLPLVEIAAALHYSDATAFSRAFSGWAGVAPSRWRDGG